MKCLWKLEQSRLTITTLSNWYHGGKIFQRRKKWNICEYTIYREIYIDIRQRAGTRHVQPYMDYVRFWEGAKCKDIKVWKHEKASIYSRVECASEERNRNRKGKDRKEKKRSSIIDRASSLHWTEEGGRRYGDVLPVDHNIPYHTIRITSDSIKRNCARRGDRMWDSWKWEPWRVAVQVEAPGPSTYLKRLTRTSQAASPSVQNQPWNYMITSAHVDWLAGSQKCTSAL